MVDIERGHFSLLLGIYIGIDPMKNWRFLKKNPTVSPRSVPLPHKPLEDFTSDHKILVHQCLLVHYGQSERNRIYPDVHKVKVAHRLSAIFVISKAKLKHDNF